MDFSFDNLNYNSVENVPCIEARAAVTLNSESVSPIVITLSK